MYADRRRSAILQTLRTIALILLWPFVVLYFLVVAFIGQRNDKTYPHLGLRGWIMWLLLGLGVMLLTQMCGGSHGTSRMPYPDF